MMENVHFIGQFWRMRNASSWELHYDSYPVRLHCCCYSTWCSQTPSWSRGCCPGPAGRSAGWTGWRGPRCSSWSRSQGTPGPRVGDHLAETQRRECRTCSSSSDACKYEQIHIWFYLEYFLDFLEHSLDFQEYFQNFREYSLDFQEYFLDFIE